MFNESSYIRTNRKKIQAKDLAALTYLINKPRRGNFNPFFLVKGFFYPGKIIYFNQF